LAVLEKSEKYALPYIAKEYKRKKTKQLEEKSCYGKKSEEKKIQIDSTP
jgi:hypothetical protein